MVFDDVNVFTDRLKHSFITSLTSWAGLIYEGEYSLVSLLMYSLVFLSFWMVGCFLLFSTFFVCFLYTICIIWGWALFC